MIDTTTSTSQSWRDLIPHLTATQVSLFETAAQRPQTTPDELLAWARERVQANAEKAQLDARLSYIEVPAGATTDGWTSIRPDDGAAIRMLHWADHNTSSRVSVAVSGWQDERGQIVRHVALCSDRQDDLTAAEARQLAEALNAAADELDRLQ